MQVSNGEGSLCLRSSARVLEACPTYLVLVSTPAHVAVWMRWMCWLEFIKSPLAIAYNYSSWIFVTDKYSRVRRVPVVLLDGVLIGYCDPFGSDYRWRVVMLPLFDHAANMKWWDQIHIWIQPRLSGVHYMWPLFLLRLPMASRRDLYSGMSLVIIWLILRLEQLSSTDISKLVMPLSMSLLICWLSIVLALDLPDVSPRSFALINRAVGVRLSSAAISRWSLCPQCVVIIRMSLVVHQPCGDNPLASLTASVLSHR